MGQLRIFAYNYAVIVLKRALELLSLREWKDDKLGVMMMSWLGIEKESLDGFIPWKLKKLAIENRILSNLRTYNIITNKILKRFRI